MRSGWTGHRFKLALLAGAWRPERFALVFAVREPSAVQELDGLPELVVEGLGPRRPPLAGVGRDRTS
jgi:hypothetical protein